MTEDRVWSLRVGQGFDVHPFAHDHSRPLVLGGVVVSPRGGLDGHSDADVLCHALCDALLGAAALGDLGQHFPDHDPDYAGIESTRLLTHVMGQIGAAGWQVVNADATVVAQRPRLSPFVDRIQHRLSGAMDAPVSVKATTAEGLGAIGRAEGIACLAVVLLGPAAP